MNQVAPKLLRCAARAATLAALLLLATAADGSAQSADPSAATPVFAGEIGGRIAPLDLGDPRLTRHFYTFRTQPGDLELTVESDNLEGDIDLFTASMRPLTKITLYTGINSRVTKTVFFRAGDSLILRVQARTPNDAEGNYRIHLGGAFQPAPVTLAAEESAGTAETASAKSPDARPVGKGVRRVSSVGARIEEPKSEVADAPEVAQPAEPSVAPKPEPAGAEPVRKTAPRVRPAVPRKGAPRNSGAGEAPVKAETDETGRLKSATAPDATAAVRPNPTAARANRTRSPRARGGGAVPKKSESAASEAKPGEATTATPPAPPSGAAAPTGLELPGTRLVIELRSGEKVVREMMNVRRVTVERGLIIIVSKSGQIERQPLANVARISIEP